MGFWQNLFASGDNATPSAAAPSSGMAVLDKDFIEIRSRNFYGCCSRSPNGRYILAWSDAGPTQSRRGRWILLDGDTVIADGRMPRPNDGKVTDEGVFILNDWGAIEKLSGTFKAFRRDGSVIFTRRTKANLFNNGLAPDGHWAVCQTCNADSEDSSKLFVFDLKVGREVGSWMPESGWANYYRFAPDGQTITLGYSNGGAFRYAITGEFLDRTLWLSMGLQQGDLYIVQTLLSEVGGKPTGELVLLLLPAIEKGMSAIHPTQGKTRAFGLKLRGQCYDAISEPRLALEAYAEALSLDPKVGVKRRADQLRKIILA